MTLIENNNLNCGAIIENVYLKTLVNIWFSLFNNKKKFLICNQSEGKEEKNYT